MSKKLPRHLTTGGPGDKYIGGGKIDTTDWFALPELDQQIKDQEIWFCSAPFQMFFTNTLGEYYPCSWAADKPNAPTVNDMSIVEYFQHDEELNELRREMITPGSDLKTAKKVCKECLSQELKYGRSRRQASLKNQTNDQNIWHGIRKSVQAFKKVNHGVIKHRIFEVQVKAFGNQCNLDCYMCMPFDSTTRTKTLNHDALDEQYVFNDEAMLAAELMTRITIDIKDLVNQIAKLAPYIYNLKLIGGEPLVMKQYYQLLDAIVKSGHSENMNVKYQTNMSVLTYGKYKFTDYVDKFDLFEITVSLDSIGIANDYIRRRSSWDQIVENIKLLNTYDNVRINVNGAISFLSVLRFYELIEWFDQNNHLFGQINWSNIRYPKLLCANVLPDKIKEDLIPKYEGFPDIQNLLREGNGGLDYEDSLRYIDMMDWRYLGTKWEMNFLDVFPELKEYCKWKSN